MIRSFTEEIRVFLTAVMFFTRLPVPGIGFSAERQNASARYIPLVGWIVGGTSALIFALAQSVLSLPAAVLSSMAAGALLTGALHEDGFADVCDGFGGGRDRETILRIMKDSTLGTYGVLGLSFLLAFKFLFLLRLAAEPGAVVLLAFALVSAHGLSRFSAASLLFTHAYVSDAARSKSGAYARPMSPVSLFVAAVGGLVPLVLFAAHREQPALFFCLLPLLLVHLSLARLFKKKIGGYTGDCAGALQQTIEVLFYACLQPELILRLQDLLVGFSRG